MSVLHRISLPSRRSNLLPIPSPLGEWECCADEVHSFCEPMVQTTLAIDADHTLHLFCEADQVDAAIEVLRLKLAEQSSN